ncbi:hypothetical protein, partial [Streptomyces goshikiensis]|uniref:hypothetical protein n=1 Tax=Streptomyces goshikiensis TaxID=1942 RepID=UPI0036653EE5
MTTLQRAARPRAAPAGHFVRCPALRHNARPPRARTRPPRARARPPRPPGPPPQAPGAGYGYPQQPVGLPTVGPGYQAVLR